MADNEKLIDILNDFDSAEPLSKGFGDEDLKQIAILSSSKNKEDHESARINTPKKVKGLIAIVNKVANKINANLVAKYPTMKPFNVINAVTYNASSASGKIEIAQAGKGVQASFNIKNLAVLPGLEVVALVTKKFVDAVARENNQLNENGSAKDSFIDDLLKEEQSEKSDKKTIEESKKKANISAKAQNVIAEYLKKYISTVYKDNFKAFDNISNAIASEIVADMSEQDISKVLGLFFDFESAGISNIADAKIENLIDSVYGARVGCLNKKVSEYLVDPNKDVEALNYQQQATALMGSFDAQSENSVVLQNFDKMNSGEVSLKSQEAKSFCEFYINSFLSAQNIQNINITYEKESDGSIASFTDGATPTINIDLDRLAKNGNVTELAVCLSHELNHVRDSIKNRRDGKVKDGAASGLINTMGCIDYDSLSFNAEEKKLVSEMQRYCYRLDQNERNGREGELSGLLFMQERGVKNPNLKREMNESVSKYIRFQKRTKEMLEELPAKLSEFEARFEQLKGKGSLKTGSNELRVMERRLNYLRDNGQNIDLGQEERTIKVAEEILNKVSENDKKKELAELGVEREL